MFKRIAVIVCGALSIGALYADQWNKKTVVTFSEAVEIPGVVLPAGQYVFKLFDSTSNRNIVQVFNAEENEIYATILAIPHYRLQPTGDTVILFEERNVGKPQAVHAWFYPGDNYGQEFVYPKQRAVELARETQQPVLSANVAPTETVEELEETPVVEVTPDDHEIKLEEPSAPNVSAPVVPEAATVTPAPLEELPETASSLPLIGLLGVYSVGLAWLLHATLKRVS